MNIRLRKKEKTRERDMYVSWCSPTIEDSVLSPKPTQAEFSFSKKKRFNLVLIYVFPKEHILIYTKENLSKKGV
jgi:hypothetical protein